MDDFSFPNPPLFFLGLAVDLFGLFHRYDSRVSKLRWRKRNDFVFASPPCSCACFYPFVFFFWGLYGLISNVRVVGGDFFFFLITEEFGKKVVCFSPFPDSCRE